MNDPYETLQEWKKGVRIYQIAHLRAAARHKRLGRLLGIPVVIFSVAIGTSVFTTLASSKHQWVLIVVGAVSVVSAVLSGLQSFLNYGESGGAHQNAGVEYGKLRHRIEELLATVQNATAELPAALAEIRQAWDALDSRGPCMPQRDIDAAMKLVQSGTEDT